MFDDLAEVACDECDWRGMFDELDRCGDDYTPCNDDLTVCLVCGGTTHDLDCF